MAARCFIANVVENGKLNGSCFDSKHFIVCVNSDGKRIPNPRSNLHFIFLPKGILTLMFILRNEIIHPKESFKTKASFSEKIMKKNPNCGVLLIDGNCYKQYSDDTKLKLSKSRIIEPGLV